MKEIEILIHQDGTVDLEVTGCAGPECEALTREAEAALGPVTRRRRKAEFYQGAQTKTPQRAQHG
jgi:hypothetical protein